VIFKFPESPNWFAATFGEEIGQNLAATYKSSWKDYKDNIRNMFRDSGTKKHTHAFVKESSASSPAHILRNAKSPLLCSTRRAQERIVKAIRFRASTSTRKEIFGW